MIKLFKKHNLLFLSFVFFFLFTMTVRIFAAPPTTPYNPAETLNPTCAPTDTNCFVQIYPTQSGNSGKFLTTDGSITSWASVPTGPSFVNDTNVTMSSSGATHTLGWTGTLAPARGGTGLSSYSTGDILYASGATTLAKLTAGSTGKFLTISGGIPAWGDAVDLTNAQTVGGVKTFSSFPKVSGSGSPSDDRELTTKQYVDSIAQGLSVRASVRVATTTAGTLTTSFENGDTIDGIVLATNDRILIKDQSTGSQNGIYTVNATGSPTRATDYDQDAEVVSGSFTSIISGTTNANTQWALVTPDPITVGVTSLTFSQLSAQQSYTASAGVQKVGLDFRINPADSITWTAEQIFSGNLKLPLLTASKLVFTDSLKVLTTSGTVGVDQGGTGTTSFTAGGILYGTGASAIGVTGAGTAGQAVLSGGAGSPTFTASTLALGVNFITAGTGALTLTTGATATNATLPTGTITLVDLAATQTLSNKTLTAPVINVTSDATGDIYYRDSGGLFTRRAIGTANQCLIVSGGLLPVWGSCAAGGAVTSAIGTANQVNVSSATGDVTFSLPQNIHTGATPTFASQTLSSTTNQLTLGTTNTTTISSIAPSASRTATIPALSANDTFAFLGQTQTFSGANTFSSDITVNGITVGKGTASVATNTALGLSALLADTTGSNNTATGWKALLSNTTGSDNTGNGYQALFTNLIGSNNTAYGSNSLLVNTASDNTAIGMSALYANTTGTANTAVGLGAGYANSGTLASNSNSVFLGYQTNTSTNGLTNVIVIGSTAQGTASNQVVLGNASITQTILRGNLVQGGITYTYPASQSAGSVLLNDGSGGLTWATAPSGTNFIQNQTTQQASSNFNISGAGVIGTTLIVGGIITTADDLAVNGADITTTSTGTATLFNTNAVTLNIGGATTATSGGINFAGGSSSTGCSINGATGDLACTGSVTGGSTLGSANQIFAVNNAGTANEYKTLSVSSTAVSNDVGVTLTGANAIVLNIPSASDTVRGVVTTGTQTFAGAKTFNSLLRGESGAIFKGTTGTGSRTDAQLEISNEGGSSHTLLSFYNANPIKENAFTFQAIRSDSSVAQQGSLYFLYPNGVNTVSNYQTVAGIHLNATDLVGNAADNVPFLAYNINSVRLLAGLTSALPHNTAIAANSLLVGGTNTLMKVGINTLSPSDVLDVQGNQNATTNFYLRNTDTTNTTSRAILNVIGGNRTLRLQSINGDHQYLTYTSGTNMYFQEGASTVMTLLNGGTVGIGTTNPQKTLHIDSSTNGTVPLIRLESGNGSAGDTPALEFYVQSGAGAIPRISAPLVSAFTQDMVFETVYDAGGSTSTLKEGMRILGAGNVGIGTTLPTSILHLAGAEYSPSTSGSAQNSDFRVGATTTALVTDFGVQSTGTYSWIQARNRTDYSTNYSLSLNPNGGNVGIGRTDPQTLLQIGSVGSGTGEATNHGQILLQSSAGPETTGGLEFKYASAGSGYGFKIYSESTNDVLSIARRANSATWTNAFSIKSTDGNVGIGTTNPSTLLHIDSATNDTAKIRISGNATTAATSAAELQLYDRSADNNFNLRYIDNSVNSGGQFRISKGTSGANTSDYLTIEGSTGALGIGTIKPSGILSVTPSQYSTGTASQSTTTITGSGTTFTSAMVGSQFVFADGTNAGTITAFTDTTHITVSTSQTVSSQAFNIGYTGLQVGSTGNVGIGTTSPTEKLTINTGTGTLGGLGIFGDTATNRDIYFGTANNGAGLRWLIRTNSTVESGSNVGSDFEIGSRTDAGASIGTPFFIKRSTGNVGIGTTTPGYKLDIAADASTVNNLRVYDTRTQAINQSEGIIDFGGYSDSQTTLVTFAQLRAFKTNGTSGNTKGYFQIWTNNGTASTAQVTVLDTGNVGIGTTSPDAPLEIENVTGGSMRLTRTTASATLADSVGQFDFYNGATRTGVIQSSSGGATDSGQLNFWTKATGGSLTERMTILASGDVGIGTISPISEGSGYIGLSIAGTDASGRGGYLSLMRGSTHAGQILANSSELAIDTKESKPLNFYIASASKMIILSDGKVGIGDTTPDALLDVKGTVCLDLNADEACTDNTAALSDSRLKTNVLDLMDGLQLVGQLRPVRFTWNGENHTGTANSLGFIAQEVEVIFPELVITDTAGYKNLDYSKLVAVLAKAMQEEDAKVMALTLRIDSMNSIEDGEGTFGSVAKAFLATSADKIINGIVYLKDVIADSVTTKRLCLEDVCITKTELSQMLASSGASSATPPPPPPSEPPPEGAPDTTPPSITLLGEQSITISQGAPYTDAGATATDDTDGDITSSIITVNPVDTMIPGTYTVTYNVSDQAGNPATEVTRTVTVEVPTDGE